MPPGHREGAGCRGHPDGGVERVSQSCWLHVHVYMQLHHTHTCVKILLPTVQLSCYLHSGVNKVCGVIRILWKYNPVIHYKLILYQPTHLLKETQCWKCSQHIKMDVLHTLLSTQRCCRVTPATLVSCRQSLPTTPQVDLIQICKEDSKKKKVLTCVIQPNSYSHTSSCSYLCSSVVRPFQPLVCFVN